MEACAIAYVAGEPEPRRRCGTYPVPSRVVDLPDLDTGGKRLEQVLFQLKLDDEGPVEATRDDAPLFVVGIRLRL